MSDHTATNFSDIRNIKDLRDVCESIMSDAHTQIQKLAYRVDSEANELRITYKARLDLASNLLIRSK